MAGELDKTITGLEDLDSFTDGTSWPVVKGGSTLEGTAAQFSTYLTDKGFISTGVPFTTADHDKLDGIEASADVTDAANVLAAGAVMTTGAQTVAGDKTLSGTTLKTGQPAFSAFQASDDNNVIGTVGTGAYTINIDTEIFDTGGDFNTTTHTFTAPVSGKYVLHGRCRVQGLTAAADLLAFRITTSNRNYSKSIVDTNDISETETLDLTVIADMDAGDTATISAEARGEASDVVDIAGTAPLTMFSGYLLG